MTNTTDSLIGKLEALLTIDAEGKCHGLYDAGVTDAILVVHEHMGDASTRKDEESVEPPVRPASESRQPASNSPAQPREISDNEYVPDSDLEALNKLYEHIHGMDSGSGDAMLLHRIYHYLLQYRTRKPVIVSLQEMCAVHEASLTHDSWEDLLENLGKHEKRKAMRAAIVYLKAQGVQFDVRD